MLRLILREAFRDLRRTGSPDLSALVVSALLLSLLGGVLGGIYALTGLRERVLSRLEVEVFLRQDITEAQRAQIREILPLLAGVDSLRHVSRARAQEEFLTTYPQYRDLIKELRLPIPFPESFRLSLRPSLWRWDRLLKLVRKIELLPGVEEVYYGGRWLQQMERLITALFLSGFLVLLAVLFSVSFVIFQSVKLSVGAKAETLEIMELEGASPATVRAPFLLRGTTYGLISGILAIGVLLLLREGLPEGLRLLLPDQLGLYLLLPLLGGFTGFLGARAALQEVWR